MIKKLISRLQLARDDIRRWLALRLFDSPKKSADLSLPIRHILLVRWDAKWGDAIVSSSFIPEIKKNYPDARVTVLAPANMVEYFSDDLGADQALTFSKRPTYRQLKQTAKEVGHCDLTVHLSPRLKMKDLYFFSKLNTENIAGMDDQVQAINIKLGKESTGQHFSEVYSNLLVLLGIPSPDNQYLVPRNHDSKENITRFLSNYTAPIISVNPYGSGSSRQLTADTTKHLINEINKVEPNITICILITPDKKTEAAEICSLFDNVIYYDGTKSIYDSIEIIDKSTAIISVDTAIVHIATGLKKPTLALYNQDDENYSRWHPNNPIAISINSNRNIIPDINNIPWTELSIKIEKLTNIITH